MDTNPTIVLCHAMLLYKDASAMTGLYPELIKSLRRMCQNAEALMLH